MSPSSRISSASDDITFEVLILKQLVAPHSPLWKREALPRRYAEALRGFELWEKPVVEGRPRRVASPWKAAALAGMISAAPLATMPAWAEAQLRVGLSVIDARTGKPLAGARILGEHGELVGVTGSDGRLTLMVPSGATDRFVIEKPGYRSFSIVRTQLRDSNLIAMLPAPAAEPVAKATPKETPQVVAKATATPHATAKPKPTHKPELHPTAKPKVALPEAHPTAKPKATHKPEVHPTAKPKVAHKPEVHPTPKAPVTHAPVVHPTPKAPVTHAPVAHATPKAPATHAPEVHPTVKPVPSPSAHEAPQASPTFDESPAPVLSPKPRPATRAAHRTYVVRRGDSLWSIAKRQMGDPTRWKVLFESNQPPLKRASLLQPGMVLTIPVAVQQPSAGWVTVRPGDSLWRIAEREYGRGEQWGAIYRSNRSRIEHPHWIKPGTRLWVPR